MRKSLGISRVRRWAQVTGARAAPPLGNMRGEALDACVARCATATVGEEPAAPLCRLMSELPLGYRKLFAQSVQGAQSFLGHLEECVELYGWSPVIPAVLRAGPFTAQQAGGG